MKGLVLAALVIPSAFAASFTFEQALSAHVPTATRDFQGVKITNYTEADRRDVGQLRRTPGLRAVVYTRGEVLRGSGSGRPALLIYGDDDRNVNFAQPSNLTNALRPRGVYFEQRILHHEIHTFLCHASWLRGYHAAADFSKRKL